MSKIKGFMLNRKQYERIRRMDHCQMTLYIESLYKMAYEDGHKAAEGLNSTEIREVLLGIKGIGEKKVDAIVEALNEAIDKKVSKTIDTSIVCVIVNV